MKDQNTKIVRLPFTRQEFIDMYYSKTYLELQKIMHMDSTTLTRFVQSLGLSKKKGRRKKEEQC